jgi:hypothetical protein
MSDQRRMGPGGRKRILCSDSRRRGNKFFSVHILIATRADFGSGKTRMDCFNRVFRSAALSIALCCVGCTSSHGKDVSAAAFGTGAGAVVCIATLFFCPVVLAAGAGGAMLIRTINVSRYENCMRSAPRNINGIRARAKYCETLQCCEPHSDAEGARLGLLWFV